MGAVASLGDGEIPSTPVGFEQLSQNHSRGNLPSLAAVILYLRADLYRYQGGGRAKFLRHFLFTPGYKYTVWMRLTGWATTRPALKYTIGLPLKAILSHCRYKYGIAIPEYTEVGPGFFINRFGGIYVNGDVVFGANVNLAQMTVIGQTNRGSRAGSPTIGDRVQIAAGSSIIGRITVGNDAVVGLSAVVSKDVEPMSVVVGNPGRVVSMQGSDGYVNRLVPEELLERCRAARAPGTRRAVVAVSAE